MSVHVGTSGWSYPSGKGKWNGLFYPATRAKRDGTSGFDELHYYAEHFDTVEVNTTFYGQPRPEVAADWARRTPAGFSFSLKLYQKFTHPKMFREAALKTAPGSGGTLLDALAQVTQSDIDDFRAGIEPIARAGKLGALLAQFPPSFKNSATSRDYLTQLLTAFTGYPIAVELRHRSWSDALGDTLALLNVFQAAWVQIDEPKFPSSIRQDLKGPPADLYYLRLHGRNAKEWWDHAESEDRYNYFYSAEELQPIADKVRDVRAMVKKAYLFLNNHFSAQSVANAVTLKKMLDEPIKARMPAELVERFPDLAGIVATLPRARLL